jgi:transposase-like protein
MVTIKVLCPHCGSDDIVRYGKAPNGHQRYLCRDESCLHKVFQLEYSYKSCVPGTREKIVDMIQNGSGTRDVFLGFQKTLLPQR